MSSSDRRHENINRKGILRTSKQREPWQEFDLKKVIFDEVNIREYPRILGDNPAVSIGKINKCCFQYSTILLFVSLSLSLSDAS
jgi:hypothetical protein